MVLLGWVWLTLKALIQSLITCNGLGALWITVDYSIEVSSMGSFECLE